MRKIFNYTWNDIDEEMITNYFMSYASAKDEKYEEFIDEAKEIVAEKAKVIVVYDSFPRAEFDALGFEGEVLKKAMANSESVYVTVSAIINEKEILDAVMGDPLVDFFAQSWMVAILNSLRDTINTAIIENELAGAKKLSSIWSPGQADIPLENQKIIFDVLKPEDLQITITKHMKMKPQMSVSGIMGTMDIECEEKYNSCDLCNRKEDCPGYNGITLKGQEFNRRLK